MFITLCVLAAYIFMSGCIMLAETPHDFKLRHVVLWTVCGVILIPLTFVVITTALVCEWFAKHW